jgi:hypothetical protein
MAAKSTSIKGAGGKFGGCALKAVSLIAGGLPHVPESGLRVERSSLTVRQKSAAGVVGHAVGAASEALQGRKAEKRLGQPGTMGRRPKR